jgi:hypothetical protein
MRLVYPSEPTQAQGALERWIAGVVEILPLLQAKCARFFWKFQHRLESNDPTCTK